MPTIIAVDAMGADRAPKPEIEGALLATRHYDVEVVLVGKEDVIRAELDLHRFWRRLPVTFSAASFNPCSRSNREAWMAGARLNTIAESAAAAIAKPRAAQSSPTRAEGS